MWGWGWERDKGPMIDPDPFIDPDLLTGHGKHEDTLLYEGGSPPPWVCGLDPVQLAPAPGGVGRVERNDRPNATSWIRGKATPSSSKIKGKKPWAEKAIRNRNRNNSTTGLIQRTTTILELSEGQRQGDGEREAGSNDLPLPVEVSPNFGDAGGPEGGAGGGGEGAGRPISLHSANSAAPSDPPPTYGHSLPRDSPHPDPTQMRTLSASFSPELVRFASTNRDMINENLEARLQAAGYLPTDDPSNLTPEEWRVEYGITRLELRRLQDLYTR